MNGKEPRAVILVALILLMLSAVFPPRMYTGSSKTLVKPARTFLFSPHLYWQRDGAGVPEASVLREVSVSIGGMLAEWMLIAAGAGAACVVLERRRQTAKDGDSV